MIVELKGVEFENKGSQLMLLSIIEYLRREKADVKFALTASKFLPKEHFNTIPAYKKLALRKNWLDLNTLSYWIPLVVRKALIRIGWILEADIDMVIDAAGFAYSDQLPSKIRIYHLTNELSRFHKNKKLYMFFPQAFGPFHDQTNRRRISGNFKKATMIYARERQSREYIEETTGYINNLSQVGDFTNLMRGVVPDWFSKDGKMSCIIPNIHMLSAKNTDRAWPQRYEKFLLETIACYQNRQIKPFFLNFGGEPDRLLIETLNKKLSQKLTVIDENDSRLAKGIISASDAVVSSRYHGCVSALSNGKVCIGAGWSHKYNLLYESYHAEELLVPATYDVMILERLIDLSLSVDASVTQKIAARADILKEESGKMWSEVCALIEAGDRIRR